MNRNRVELKGIIVNDISKGFTTTKDGNKRMFARINLSVVDSQIQRPMLIPIVFYNYKKDVVPSRFKVGDEVSVIGKLYTKPSPKNDGMMYVTIVASKINMVYQSKVSKKSLEQKYKEIRLQYHPDIVEWRINNG